MTWTGEIATSTTSTSSISPTEITPPTPPGGGVPPGGTTPVFPVSRREESFDKNKKSPRYFFWDDEEFPFDTSYPWERENIVSGWTARKRRIKQKRARRGAGRQFAENQVLYADGSREKLFDVQNEGNAVKAVFKIKKGTLSASGSDVKHFYTNKGEKGDGPRAPRDEEESDIASTATFKRARQHQKPNFRNATKTASSVGEESASIPKIELLHGEDAREAVKRKLEGLNGFNGRRFKSLIPVHKSQFVDGFTGKIVINIPPFFAIPPQFF